LKVSNQFKISHHCASMLALMSKDCVRVEGKGPVQKICEISLIVIRQVKASRCASGYLGK